MVVRCHFSFFQDHQPGFWWFDAYPSPPDEHHQAQKRGYRQVVRKGSGGGLPDSRPLHSVSAAFTNILHTTWQEQIDNWDHTVMMPLSSRCQLDVMHPEVPIVIQDEVVDLTGYAVLVQGGLNPPHCGGWTHLAIWHRLWQHDEDTSRIVSATTKGDVAGRLQNQNQRPKQRCDNHNIQTTYIH